VNKHAPQTPVDAAPRDLDDPRLACLIQSLDPSIRGMAACHTLKVRTIRDFLSRSRRDFTSLRNCGRRTYDDLVRRVHQFLTNVQGTDHADSSINSLDRPLTDVVDNPRALRAFAALRIQTIQDFLETPKQRLLSVRGFGERSYWEVTQRIRELSGPRSQQSLSLPNALLDFPVHHMRLEYSVSTALERHTITTVGDLIATSSDALHTDPSIGQHGMGQLRMALEHLVRDGTDRTTEQLVSEQSEDLTNLVR